MVDLGESPSVYLAPSNGAETGLDVRNQGQAPRFVEKGHFLAVQQANTGGGGICDSHFPHFPHFFFTFFGQVPLCNVQEATF